MSLIKNQQDQALLRKAGKKLAYVLQQAGEKVVPGISLVELDDYIHEMIIKEEATPSFLGYEGYPKSACLSLNAQVVHGIPDQRILKEGDILGVDVGLWYQGVCVDTAETFPVGSISEPAQHLIEWTQEALKAGIKAAKPFRRVGAISHAIQEVAEAHHLGIVRTLTGHGVGHQVHEAPSIPNYGHSTDGALLKPGMVLAIEPMFTMGNGEVITEVDGWTVVTADGTLSAHSEHTVIITSQGAEVITRASQLLQH